MRSLAFLLFFGLFILACSNGDSTADTTNSESETTASTETTSPKPLSTDTKYILTPFVKSQTFEDAEIKTVSYFNDTWKFDIAGETYQLGVQTPDADQKMCANSDKGQHIHLIVDNEPYKARYTSEFNDAVMEPGDYNVLAFLSRSYHESIKTPKAFIALKMKMVKGPDGSGYYKTAETINSPMIWYSRPKGTYIGKKNTDKVMLDFYLTNVELSESGYKVKANINGEEDHMLTSWEPYYIENLPMGKNTITLTLLDQYGATVDAPFNPVTREFELKADALE